MRGDAFAFDAIVGLAGGEVFVFFGSAAGPRDSNALDLVAFAQAEGDRQLGLRQIA